MAESPHRLALLPKAEPRTPKDAACPPFHPVQQALKAQVGTPWSLRLCIFSFGLLQDGNVGVGVFPEIEEIVIGGTSAPAYPGKRSSRVRPPGCPPLLYRLPESRRAATGTAGGYGVAT